MSGLLARASATTALVVLVACAQIANIEEGDPRTSSKSSGTSSGSESSGGTTSGGTTSENEPTPSNSDASTAPPADANTTPPPVCQAPRKPNEESCSAPSECCSDSCNEDGKCHDKCKTNDFCDPSFGNGDDCCIGRYCPAALPFRCKTCLGAGADPDGNMKKSCCSRDIDGNGKCK